jgi:hypothetical protein
VETYKERINRWRIIRHDELPEAHKAEYRLNGIDPDDNWTLVWSFNEWQAARDMLVECEENKASWQTFKLVDGGGPTEVERSAWL